MKKYFMIGLFVSLIPSGAQAAEVLVADLGAYENTISIGKAQLDECEKQWKDNLANGLNSACAVTIPLSSKPFIVVMNKGEVLDQYWSFRDHAGPGATSGTGISTGISIRIVDQDVVLQMEAGHYSGASSHSSKPAKFSDAKPYFDDLVNDLSSDPENLKFTIIREK